MKKILIFIGSRKEKSSNTYAFIHKIILSIQSQQSVEVEYIFPQTYYFSGVDGSDYMFRYAKDNQNDEFSIIKSKILKADFLILASPVYAHAVSGDVKNLIDRLSYWAHIIRLAGKGSAVFSTNMSNGHNSVIDYLEKVLTSFGSYVVAKYNISTHTPPELNNQIYMDAVSKIMGQQIMTCLSEGVVVLEQHEQLFKSLKETMLFYKKNCINTGEWQFWDRHKLFECKDFTEVIDQMKRVNDFEEG